MISSKKLPSFGELLNYSSSFRFGLNVLGCGLRASDLSSSLVLYAIVPVVVALGEKKTQLNSKDLSIINLQEKYT